MNEMIIKFIRNAQIAISPMISVIGVYFIIMGLIRLAGGNESAGGGAGGGRMILVGSFLTCHKLMSSVVVSTLVRCGFDPGNILPQ